MATNHTLMSRNDLFQLRDGIRSGLVAMELSENGLQTVQKRLDEAWRMAREFESKLNECPIPLTSALFSSKP